MERKITCLIFDFDGVIADTDSGRFKILKRILSKYDTAKIQSFSKKDLIGLSTKSFLKKFTNDLSDKDVDKIIKERYKLFYSNLSDYCIPYPNMKTTIEKLSSQYDLAIVTTNSKENVLKLLEHLGVLLFFKWIIGREECENNLVKTYTKVSGIINKNISECVVIEDSNYGVESAKKENFLCVRFDPDKIFDKRIEDFKVESYNGLTKLLTHTLGNTSP